MFTAWLARKLMEYSTKSLAITGKFITKNLKNFGKILESSNLAAKFSFPTNFQTLCSIPEKYKGVLLEAT